MPLQEMSDRLEIQDLFARYSFAIDDRNWDALDEVFTEDAFIDYREAGGGCGSLPEIKRYLADAMAKFSGFQHLVATTELKLDGDHATSRTILFNPMVTEQAGKSHVFFVGVWYVDELVRTSRGWRIRSRREKLSYFHNLPGDVPAP
jgi:hypothetical protein